MIALLERARRENTELGYITEATRRDLDRYGISAVTVEQFIAL